MTLKTFDWFISKAAGPVPNKPKGSSLVPRTFRGANASLTAFSTPQAWLLRAFKPH